MNTYHVKCIFKSPDWGIFGEVISAKNQDEAIKKFKKIVKSDKFYSGRQIDSIQCELV